MGSLDYYKIRLLKKTQLTPNVFVYSFTKPPEFTHLPGQFVKLRFELGSSLIERSYSITSRPESAELEFCIKMVPNGAASSVLLNYSVGDTIQVSEACGNFSSTKYHGNKYFISTGVGLAPFISMLEAEPNGQDKLFLIQGVGEESGIFWQDRLDNIKTQNSNFSYLLSVSRPGNNWHGPVGRVTEHLIIDKNSCYFVCGRVEMVKEVRKILIESGVNTKSIHFEIF